MTRALITSILGVLVASLSACSSTNSSSNGSLTMGGEAGTLCVPASPGKVIGVGEVIHAGSETAVISDVSLIDARDVKLEASFVGPIVNNMAVGSLDPAVDTSPAWLHRQQAGGYTIRPGEVVALIVTMSRMGNDAKTAGIRVAYDGGDREYVVSGTTEYRLADTCG